MTHPKIILASNSKTRARMLKDAGLDVDILAANIDEAEIKYSLLQDGAPADQIAIILAEMKAANVSRRCECDLILAADQILSLGGELLSKASNRAEAEATLKKLSGKKHELISAAVIMENGNTIWHDTQKATLDVRDLSDDFISQYLDALGDDAFWSVGCYQLEGLGAQLFNSVKGDYYTVLGLPLLPIFKFLRDRGDMIK